MRWDAVKTLIYFPCPFFFPKSNIFALALLPICPAHLFDFIPKDCGALRLLTHDESRKSRGAGFNALFYSLTKQLLFVFSLENLKSLLFFSVDR